MKNITTNRNWNIIFLTNCLEIIKQNNAGSTMIDSIKNRSVKFVQLYLTGIKNVNCLVFLTHRVSMRRVFNNMKINKVTYKYEYDLNYG